MGGDDPRMPTLSGLRRRRFDPEAIRHFCKRIGLTKFNALTDISLLEHSIREDLNQCAMRVMGVLKPLKVVIENLPEDHENARSHQSSRTSRSGNAPSGLRSRDLH